MSCLTSKLDNLFGLTKSKRKTRRRLSNFLNTKRRRGLFKKRRTRRRSRSRSRSRSRRRRR